MLTFRELAEKHKMMNDASWTKISLDNGFSILFSMDLLNSKKVQIDDPNHRAPKIISVAKDPIGAIEKAVGLKLDPKDTAVKKFIALLPCSTH